MPWNEILRSRGEISRSFPDLPQGESGFGGGTFPPVSGFMGTGGMQEPFFSRQIDPFARGNAGAGTVPVHLCTGNPESSERKTE